MIDPKELRIGNLVMLRAVESYYNEDEPFEERVFEWELGTFYDLLEFGVEEEVFDPIPITPEWRDRMREANPIFTKMPNLPHIKYVHQAQNLYFALTGSELTIKEPQTDSI